jgi:hypothetical protein
VGEGVALGSTPVMRPPVMVSRTFACQPEGSKAELKNREDVTGVKVSQAAVFCKKGAAHGPGQKLFASFKKEVLVFIACALIGFS